MRLSKLFFFGLLLILPLRLVAESVNLVEQGRQTIGLWGCLECHVVTKDDKSIKAGPSLYDLFRTQPRSIEVMAGAPGQKATVKADRDYFINSVRKPAEQLVVAEDGPNKGQPYPAIMPQYSPEIVSDADFEAIWHFLRFSAEEANRGPAEVMGPKPENLKSKDVLKNLAEVIVTQRPRVIRAPLLNASGRAVHVGLPNGMNYTFDPRMLSLRSVWSGGFLDLAKEQKGRSTAGSDLGTGAHLILEKEAVLTPLTADGKPVDFEFKEPDVLDADAVIKHLNKGGDFLKELAALDAEFLGYTLAAKGEPVFRFRVGKNQLTQTITFSGEGRLVIELGGTLESAQVFQLRKTGLQDIKVEGGQIAAGQWQVPAGKDVHYRLNAKICEALVARPVIAVAESFAPQSLQTAPATAELPAGYTIETWEPPTDTYGRKQLFEPMGIAVAKNGTIVVGTRTAGIWRLKNGKWELFAEGIYECLGVSIEDDAGDVIVIAQKPELTRIRDVDHDGRADEFITLCDDFGFHGNYHEYTHGPVRDAEGNYYFALNLCHAKEEAVSYRAGGAYMGSMGGYRGWACRVTPQGKFEPYASGLRSPAGIALDPQGRLVYADNQGEYFGSSKIFYLQSGKYYGHPSGLVSLPGMKPGSPEIDPGLWAKKAEKTASWFPYARWANSPGNPAWDLTKGKFGPFAQQMFIGDQTLSTLLRVVTEKVGDVDQGSMMMFGRKLSSGVMRPCFLPDGSLLLGQTGRGWVANGGAVASLQRVVWDGKTVAPTIERVSVTATGFEVFFTVPLAEALTPADVLPRFNVKSWVYQDSADYGSEEMDKHRDPISKVTFGEGRKSVKLDIPGFAQPEKCVGRYYFFEVSAPDKLLGVEIEQETLNAYYTLQAIPK